VRKAKDELTSELLNKDIPPGKWWRIAKSISNFTKARDIPICNIQFISKPFNVNSIIISYLPLKGVLFKSFE
jgi:hypothetical protein